MASKIIVLGNPGSGKSTLSNSLVDQPGTFESGFSPGTGMTRQCQQAETHWGDNVVTVIDTPGLADTLNRMSAAQEIQKALKHGGLYRLVFVMTLSSGRVRADDLLTIKYIMDAICLEYVPFGIIINKATDRTMSEFENTERWTQLYSCISVGSGYNALPRHYHLVKNFDEIEGEPNKKLPNSQAIEALKTFVLSLPCIRLHSETIAEIHPSSSSPEEVHQKMTTLANSGALHESITSEHVARLEELLEKLTIKNDHAQN